MLLIRGVLVLVSLLEALSVPWVSLPVGGGGYVTTIIASAPGSPNGPQLYSHTDVGGGYRSTANGTAWIPLNDVFTYRDRNLYGVQELALDPANALHVFGAFGCYLGLAPSGIFESVDGGGHWALRTPPSWPVQVGGNDYTHTRRATGPRLALHGSTILFGSELNGVWASRDGGGSWAQLPCNAPFPCNATAAAPDGVNLIVFDPAFRDGSVVYASLFGVGVFESADGGEHWSMQPASPASLNRCAWDWGAVAAAARAAGTPGRTPLLCSSDVGLWRLSPVPGIAGAARAAAVAWAPLPQPLGRVPFYAIDVSADGQSVFALVYSDSEDLAAVASLDGGATFIALPPFTTLDTLAWDRPGNMTGVRKSNAAATVAFDPGVPGRVWLGNWYAHWRCDGWYAAVSANASTQWTNVMPGHEEVFVLSAAAPPAGPLLVTGTADLGGFVHPASLAAYPPLSFSNAAGALGGETLGADYSEALAPGPRGAPVPKVIAVAAFIPWDGPAGSGGVSASYDGGSTWTVLAFPQNDPACVPARLAVAAYEPAAMVALVFNATPLMTADGGAHWVPVRGLPSFLYTPLSGNRYNHSSPLTSERAAPEDPPPPVGASVFWYFDCSTGLLYRSADSGATFSAVVPAAPPHPPPSERCVLLSTPAKASDAGAGTLVLAAGTAGLWQSSDGGETWAQDASVANAHAIAFGAPPPPPHSNASTPVLFLFGTLTASAGARGRGMDVAAAADLAPWAALPGSWTARSGGWVPLADETGAVGLGNWAEVIAAPRQPSGFGVLVVGSFGRGAFVGNGSAVLLQALASGQT